MPLPYLLKLERGRFLTGKVGQGLEIYQRSPGPLHQSTQTGVSASSDQTESDIWELAVTRDHPTVVAHTVDQPETDDPDERRRLKSRQIDLLLDLTNRLLRCYRSITQNAEIAELSRTVASPFRFRLLSAAADPPTWESEITFRAGSPTTLEQRTSSITHRVRDLLASGLEPEVASLFLLDAEQALHEGRFREAVLFCWST